MGIVIRHQISQNFIPCYFGSKSNLSDLPRFVPKYDWGVREKNKMYGGGSAKKNKMCGGGASEKRFNLRVGQPTKSSPRKTTILAKGYTRNSKTKNARTIKLHNYIDCHYPFNIETLFFFLHKCNMKFPLN